MSAYRDRLPQEPLLPAKDARSLIQRHRALRIALPVVALFLIQSVRIFNGPYGFCSGSAYAPTAIVMLGLVALGSLVAYGIMMWDKNTWK